MKTIIPVSKIYRDKIEQVSEKKTNVPEDLPWYFLGLAAGKFRDVLLKRFFVIFPNVSHNY
jgi:hypothetical protein